MDKSDKEVALEKEIAVIKKTIAYSKGELERLNKELKEEQT